MIPDKRDIAIVDASASVRMIEFPNKNFHLVTEFQEMISPDIFLYEIGNICWKFNQFSKWPLDECIYFYKRALRMTNIIPVDALVHLNVLTTATKFGITYYDAAYLQMAISYDATLLSADKKLIVAAKNAQVNYYLVSSV